MLLINKYDFFFLYSKVLHVVCIYESYNKIWICLGLFVHSYRCFVSFQQVTPFYFSHFHRTDDIGNLEKINHIKKQYNIVSVCLLQNNTEHHITYVYYKVMLHNWLNNDDQ